MVPRLTERLMESSDEELIVMADLVGLTLSMNKDDIDLIHRRYRRVYRLQGQMIRRV